MFLFENFLFQNDQVAAQRFTSEEKRARERLQNDIYQDVRRAAEAHRCVCMCVCVCVLVCVNK